MAEEAYNSSKRKVFKADTIGQMLFSGKVEELLISSLRYSLSETEIYWSFAQLSYLLKMEGVCA
ncbi:Uncharacterised protein [uncultured archaeon]|nr:Uncharacterised protein [uncultured archaeon]